MHNIASPLWANSLCVCVCVVPSCHCLSYCWVLFRLFYTRALSLLQFCRWHRQQIYPSLFGGGSRYSILHNAQRYQFKLFCEYLLLSPSLFCLFWTFLLCATLVRFSSLSFGFRLYDLILVRHNCSQQYIVSFWSFALHTHSIMANGIFNSNGKWNFFGVGAICLFSLLLGYFSDIQTTFDK